MTDNTIMTDAKRDGKAQAAADKAYRKASRPWFKKKRFMIPLIILVIAIVSSMANGGKSNSSATATPATDASAVASAAGPAAAAPAAAPAPAKAAPEVVQVEAGTLLADFKGNEAAADAKYKGKVLQVTGFVDKVDTEFLDKDQYIVRLDNGDKYNFLHVNCNDVPAARAATIVPESAITVRGTFQDGGDLGVELKACEVL
ncbi:hypothetical protein StoSoilB19_10080 [Arthrobacter sp. StoSoilB19]|uniref:OB-fold putative lipoprotein n=1 Tax=Arthrobacter sp. StoSoilB19 TaxID=2830994 RepID=UPI001CC3F144|nr:OB-fold putative lipoprotein [Arthrobacter sp. StoSoilB19]BCW53634.1 hypothetical protein StoSoilB19_10080 [Arthrobacter sp. StoSoilB19]